MSDRVKFVPQTVEIHHPRQEEPRHGYPRSTLEVVKISGPAVLIGEMLVDQPEPFRYSHNTVPPPAAFGTRATGKIPLRITLTAEEEQGIEVILRRAFFRYRRDLRAALESTEEE